MIGEAGKASAVDGSPAAEQEPRQRRDWLLIAAIAVAVVGSAVIFQALYDSTGDWGQLDFRIYMGSANGYPYGHSIYDYHHPALNLTATYPPIGILLFVPFSFLNIRIAEVIWLIGNMLCIVWILWLVCTHLLHLSDRRRMLVCLIGPALAIPTPMVYRGMGLGQINLWLWLAIVYDVILIRRRSKYGGLLIGLVAAVKLTPLVFILFFVVAREWRTAAKAVAGFLGATAFAWLLAPSDSYLYWTSLIWDTSRVGDAGAYENNSMRFLTSNLPVSTSVQTAVWLVAVLAIVVLGVWRASRAWRAGHVLYSVLVVGCVMALASPISWQHHLIFLPLALLLLPMPSGGKNGREHGRRNLWLEAGILTAAWIVLLDPYTYGLNSITSGIRCLLMVAIIAGLVVRTSSWLQSDPDSDADAGAEDLPGRRLAAGPANL